MTQSQLWHGVRFIIGAIVGTGVSIFVLLHLPAGYGDDLHGPALGVVAFVTIGLFPTLCAMVGAAVTEFLWRKIKDVTNA